MAAKLDLAAGSMCGPKWAIARNLSVYETAPQTSKGKTVSADHGPPVACTSSLTHRLCSYLLLFGSGLALFGRDLTKAEAYILKLNASTAASLKLAVLNTEGRVWTMVTGWW